MEPLEPPAHVLEVFYVQLWEIASEFAQFYPPADYLPHGRREVLREDRRLERYFDSHLAEWLLQVCRDLIRGWHQEAASKLGAPIDQQELNRHIARRFPIVLRKYTPRPLRMVMERPAFEKRILHLVEETLGMVLPERLHPIAGTAPQPGARAVSRPSAEPTPARRKPSRPTINATVLLSSPDNWNDTQLKAALRMVRQKFSLGKVSDATVMPDDTSKLSRETIRKAELQGIQSLKSETRDKLCYALRQLLPRCRSGTGDPG